MTGGLRPLPAELLPRLTPFLLDFKHGANDQKMDLQGADKYLAGGGLGLRCLAPGRTLSDVCPPRDAMSRLPEVQLRSCRQPGGAPPPLRPGGAEAL